MKPLKSPGQIFASISQNSIPYKAWFAILSISVEPSRPFVDIGLSLIEYLQLIIQTIYINRSLFTDTQITPDLLNTILSICRTLNPGYSLNFHPENKILALSIFLILTCYTLVKYGLLAYVIRHTIKRSLCHPVGLAVWRWSFKLQARVVYFFVSSIWLSVIRATFNDNLGLSKGMNILVLMISASIVVIEFLFALVTLIWFSYPIPSRSFTAAKNQNTEVITLIQKFVVQFLRMLVLSEASKITAWLLTLIGLIFCITRDMYFFTNLPYYKLRTIIYYSGVLLAVKSLNAAYLIFTIFKTTNLYQLDLSYIAIMWVIIGALFVKLSRNYLKRKWLDLVTKENNSEGLLIHKIVAMKEMMYSFENFASSNQNYLFSDLANSAVIEKIATTLDIPHSQLSLDDEGNLDSAKIFREFLSKYLKQLLAAYPSNNLLKLYAGYYYAKKLKIYGYALRILYELQKGSSFHASLSASHLIYLLEAFIADNRRNREDELDMHAYVGNMAFVYQMEEELYKQADLQMELYQTLTKNPQNLGKVFHLAQGINTKRTVIEKKIQKMFEMIPECFIQPTMLCAHYYLVLNHATHRYFDYIKKYNQKNIKYEKMFLADEICRENIYQKRNHLLVISGNKRDLGTVRYISKSSFGTVGKKIVDRHFCVAVSDRFKQSCYTSSNATFEAGNEEAFRNNIASFEYNFPEGSYVSCTCYFNISPFFSEGVFYLMLTRIPLQPQEYIIIEENGAIIGFTQNIGEKLGLFDYQKSINAGIDIRLISKRLAKANHAFNIAISANNGIKEGNSPPTEEDKEEHEDYHMEYQEAKELYSTYSTTGQDLELNVLEQPGDFSCRSSRQTNKRYFYNCKFEIKAYAGEAIRAILLQSLHKDDEDNKKNTVVVQREKKIESKVSDWFEDENEDSSEESVGSEHIAQPLPLKKYQSKGSETPINSSDQENSMTFRNLLTTRELITKPSGELVSKPKKYSSFRGLNTGQKQQESPEKEQDIIVPNMKKLSLYQSSRAGRRKDFMQVQLSKDFESALCAKYYPYYFRILEVLLCIVFITVLISQFMLKGLLEGDLETLEARKNVLRFGVLRTDLLLIVYGQARVLYIFAMGLQNETGIPEAMSPLIMLLEMQDKIQGLAQTNEDMIAAMNSLDVDSRHRLFEKRVRVYDIDGNRAQQRYIVNMTSFQATQKIIETGLRGVMLGYTGLQNALPEVNLILKNVLNDLLVENDYIASFLADKAAEQKDHILSFNRTIMILDLTLFWVILFLFCGTVLKQHYNSKQNMLAVGKLNITELLKVIDRVATFQNMLQKEADLQEIQDWDTYSSHQDKRDKRNEPNGFNSHKQTSLGRQQQTDLKGISRKYLLYSVRLLILLGIVIGFVCVKFIVARTSTEDLSYILDQIYFVDRIRPNIDILTVIPQDLTSENDTLVRNNPILGEFDREIYFLKNATRNMSEYLRNKDLTYDLAVKTILFENPCEYTSEFSTMLCNAMRNDLEKSGLINFMIGYQETVQNFLIEYHQTNGTTVELSALNLRTYSARILNAIVISDLLVSLSTQLDNSFSDILKEDKGMNRVVSILLIICSVIVWILLHVAVVNHVKEAENEFRNVLKVFPARLVLSNFVLKMYLSRTSKSADSAKLLSKD